MNGIPIYLRLKPGATAPKNRPRNVKVLSDNEIEIARDPRSTASTATFHFTRIFSEGATQLDLFKDAGQALVDNILHGHDSSIFTVGPSGAGKSFSILGSPSQPGLLVHCLSTIFDLIHLESPPSGNRETAAFLNLLREHYGPAFTELARQETANVVPAPKVSGKKHFVSLNIFELYTDTIVDLLDASSAAVLRRQQRSPTRVIKEITTDARDRKIRPSGLAYCYVRNIREAQEVINRAVKKRHVSSTEMNAVSSRSHIFIYANVHEVSCKEGEVAIKTSRLTVADLAGSERLRTAQNGSTRKEGNVTNLNLSELGRVLQTISSLRAPIKESDKAILRTSKMTRLLFADYLGNKDHRMSILVSIDPFADTRIILSVLRIIKPADSFQNTESIKDTTPSAVSSPAKAKILAASIVHKPQTKSAGSSIKNLASSVESQSRSVKSQSSGDGSSANANGFPRTRSIKTSIKETFMSPTKRISPLKASQSPTKPNQSPLKTDHSPIKLDSISSSPEKANISPIKLAISPSRSPSRLVRSSPTKAANIELQNRIRQLESELSTLQRHLASAGERFAEREYEIRQEAAQEHVVVIRSIENNHRELLKQFETSNVATTDAKLAMLETQMREELSKVKQDNKDLLRENSRAVTNYEQLLFKHQADMRALRELEAQINNFNNENIRLSHENKKLKREIQAKDSDNGAGVEDIGQLRDAFLREHEATIKEYQSKISNLADKLRLKTEKNKHLTEKYQKLKAANKSLRLDATQAISKESTNTKENSNAGTRPATMEGARSVKRQKTRLSNVLRESLDTSINVLPHQFKMDKAEPKAQPKAQPKAKAVASKTKNEKKKSGKKALRKNKSVWLENGKEAF